jgi:hypothetical protein
MCRVPLTAALLIHAAAGLDEESSSAPRSFRLDVGQKSTAQT